VEQLRAEQLAMWDTQPVAAPGEPYIGYAKSAADVLTSRWFGPGAPGQWVPIDYWRTPTILIELVDLMSLTGDWTDLQTVQNGRNAGQGWFLSCGYRDDQTVWGRFLIYTAARVAATDPAMAKQFESDAVSIYGDLLASWDSHCGGGLYWRRAQDPRNFKASNSTLGLAEIAAGLHAATGDAAYLSTAQKAVAWVETSKLIDDGMVWGGLLPAPACTVDPKNVPVVALQGNPLLPLWQLYAATGDTAYLDTGQAIADATMKGFVWPGTQILMTPVDAQWESESPQWHTQNNNVTPFKGIFAGYLGDFAANLATVDDSTRQATAASYAAFLRANADALWANYSKGVFGMDWHEPHPEYKPDPPGIEYDQVNGCVQFGALAAFLAAAKNC
jgi:predicted alpha-1,6-mannanase (GH76 family)